MVIETRDVEQVAAVLRDLAARDVSVLDKDQLLEVNAAVATVEKLAGALASRCAGEIARRSTPDQPGGSLARREGFGNPGSMLSHVRGGSVAGAKRSIEAGQAFDPVEPEEQERAGDDAGGGADAGASPTREPEHRYPAVARGQMAGELSVDAAGIIVAGLTKVSERLERADLLVLEERLAVKAVGMSAHEVQKMVSRAIARVDRQDHEERERQAHADRYLWWKQDHQGVVTIKGELDAVTAAPLITVLEQMTTRDIRRQARSEDVPEDERDTRTRGQLRADALFELARHMLGCTGAKSTGVRTSLVVRMTLNDLMSGRGLGSIDGIEQPVSVSALRRLSGDAGIIPEVLGSEGEILDLGREQRYFSRAQRIALLNRDGGCAKCHAPPEHCEAHHIRWWEHGGASDLANGVMLCTRCHHDIHDYGWQVEASATGVRFIPPPDIDESREPRQGGLAALDVDVPPPRAFDPPPITQEDQALIRALDAEFAHHREDDAFATLLAPPHVAVA